MDDDSKLMADYYGCNPKALDELNARYHAMLEVYIRKYGLSKEEAEDVGQDTWIHVSSTKDGLTRFDPKRAPFKAWLYRIAKSRSIDLARKKANDPNLFCELGQVGDDDGPSEIEKVPSMEVGPEQLVMAREMLEELRSRNRTYALVFWLVHMERLKAVEIKCVLGLKDKKAAYNLTHRANNAMAELGEVEPEKGGDTEGEDADDAEGKGCTASEKTASSDA